MKRAHGSASVAGGVPWRPILQCAAVVLVALRTAGGAGVGFRRAFIELASASATVGR